MGLIKKILSMWIFRVIFKILIYELSVFADDNLLANDMQIHFHEDDVATCHRFPGLKIIVSCYEVQLKSK